MLAVLLLFREWGLWFGDAIVWPFVLAAAGGALIWRQSASAAAPAPQREEAERRRAGGSALGRAALGVALVVGAALLFLYFNDALQTARDVVLPVVVVLVAVALILAPWWIRLVRGLADERAERIRSQERAEVAAHLHDSVLQTLALMQRQRRRPARGRRARPPPGARAARVAQRRPRRGRARDARRRRSSRRGRGRGATTACRSRSSRSATARSTTTPRRWSPPRARRSSTPPSSPAPSRSRVYAEVGRGRASRSSSATAGRASTPTRCPADRRGVRESIVGRMERHGGRAMIHRRRATGTEVELRMRRSMSDAPTVVIVDDHALFRAGVRAELDGLVEVLGDAADGRGRRALHRRARARRRAARRPHAGRRRRRGHPATSRASGRPSASSRCRSPTPPRT